MEPFLDDQIIRGLVNHKAYHCTFFKLEWSEKSGAYRCDMVTDGACGVGEDKEDPVEAMREAVGKCGLAMERT